MPRRYTKLHNQNYHNLFLTHSRKGENFQDEFFPPVDASLWRISQPIRGEVVWKRCKDLCRNPHLFIFENGRLSPEVVQGAVGNCWLVSALGVLTAHPHLLNKVVPKWTFQDWVHSDEPGRQLGVYHLRDTQRHPGIFRFRFYRFGQWIEVVVDDYLPTINGRLIYAHSKNPNEMWCALLEKAYAKLCGCYEALGAGSASDALVDLTGSVPETIELRSGDGGILDKMGELNFVAYVLKAAKKGALMSCSIDVLEGESPQERLPNGLIIGHSYGITDIQKLRCNWKDRKAVILFRLHNPWGEFEWNGAWSDRSSEWEKISEAKRQKLGMKVEDDGDFWMAFEDFFEYFSNLVICRHLDTAWYTLGQRWHSMIFHGEWSIATETAGGSINNQATFYQNPQFAFTVAKRTVVVMALMQEDHRTMRSENLTIGFVCLKVEENRKYRIHKPTYPVACRVTYINAREVTTRVELFPGRYILIPSTYNVGEEGSYFLRIFSSRYLNISPLLKDAPVKRWYYPLLYWGKSYFAGMVRVQIMKAQLRRILSGYIKITFSDLEGRLNQHFMVPSFKRQITPVFGTEYVFYVRDPTKSNIIIQLFESHIFGRDHPLGEMRVGFENYSKQEKEGKIWEITKTLTTVVKVPQSFGVITAQEVEEAEVIPKVHRANEPVSETFQTQVSPNRNSMHAPSNRLMPNKTVKAMLVPKEIDAGIGEVQVRFTYFSGVNA